MNHEPTKNWGFAMNRNLILAAIAAVAAAVPSASFAGSIGISEFGARVSGRGTAGTALYDDTSAIFYNPANISRLEGLQLTLGGSALMPRFEYTPLSGGEATRSEFAMVPPPHLTATYNFGDVAGGPMAIGLGAYVPYGSTFGWPADWQGREEILDIGLQVFEITPVLAWQPHKMFAVGAGLRVLPANVYMKQGVNFGTEQQGTVELAGSGTAVAASAGLSFWPMDGLSLGLSWRSGASLKAEGQSHFDFAPPFDTAANDRDVRAELPLAQVFRFGVAYDVMPKLNVNADVEYQMWSAFKELKITFIDGAGAEEVVSSTRNSMDSVTLHFGGEYKVNDAIAVRAGYLWDQHTLPEETVNPAPPDSDKHLISVGGSYMFGNYGVHAYFANAFFTPRTSTTAEFPGQWRGGWSGGTMAYLMGLSLSGKFDVGGRAAAAPVAAAAAAAPVAMEAAAPVESAPVATPVDAPVSNP